MSEELRVIRARLPKESVRALADRCGVPYSTLHKTLAGERMVDVEELHKIAAGLGTKASDVLREVERRLRDEGEGGTVTEFKPKPGPRDPRDRRAEMQQVDDIAAWDDDEDDD